MELATICYDATGRRVYGERDDMKNRGRRAARLGAEEVVAIALRKHLLKI